MKEVTKLYNKEREGQIRLKGNAKRIVSGLLSAVTVLSAFLQPVGVYAAEPEPAAYEAEYPALEKVKEKLDADEIVAAEDHTVEIDSNFDMEHDFSGIEFSPGKVKVTFHEAKDKGGEKFDIGKAGTYKAVYFVKPASKNPSYHVSRNIIVKEKASVSSSGRQAADGEGRENSNSHDSEGTETDGEGDLPGETADVEEMPRESMTEAEMEAVIEGMEQAEDTRQDTGEVQKVEMKDDVTKVEISKTDIAGKELPGAKLSILDKEGKIVESWTSENKPHYMEMLPIGEYTLHEESAPDGYLVAEDVKFEVKDTGEIQKVAMKDEAKPDEPEQPKETPKPETPSAGTPKTGDDRPFWLWIALAGIAVCGIGGSIFIFRRKRKED